MQDSLNAAYRFLSYRPRSEAEIRHRLSQRGFHREVVDSTIKRLRQQNLADDLAFARFWKDNRMSFKPKSRRLIAKELREKQVAAAIVEQVTEDIDDEATAYTLGAKLVPAITHLDYPHFLRRMSGHLAYRGFAYGVVKRTADLLWQEKEDG